LGFQSRDFESFGADLEFVQFEEDDSGEAEEGMFLLNPIRREVDINIAEAEEEYRKLGWSTWLGFGRCHCFLIVNFRSSSRSDTCF
jgi:hypothetical protein